MKKLFLLLFPLVYLITGCGSEPSKNETQTTNAAFPYPIHQKKLDNGLNVVTVEYPNSGLASFYIVVRVGSREEVEPGKTGFAHFFEHMMFRGTEKYPKERYRDVLKSTGAAANANTWLDRTEYHMTGNADMLDKMFEIEADRFMNLNYSVHDFKTEAGAVKGEYTKNSASPFAQLNEKTVEVAFENHTYKHTTMGFWDDVVDMPNQYDYSLEFFDRFYRPEYTTILVVGDVKKEQVNELATKYFGAWEKGSYVPEIPAEPEQNETKYAHIQLANFPPQMWINYKSPAFKAEEKDAAALKIIAKLFFSEKSALYKKLVIEEQKLESLDNFYLFTRDPFLFSINTSLKDAKDFQYIKDEITNTLEDLKENPVDSVRLAETKSNMKYSFAMRINSPSAIANILSYFIWATGDPESVNTYYESLQSVTQEDLMEVAREYFVPEKLVISTISPNETEEISR